jgi:hypothetical protein
MATKNPAGVARQAVSDHYGKMIAKGNARLHRRDPQWEAPPEAPHVKAQRAANDARGRKLRRQHFGG